MKKYHLADALTAFEVMMAFTLIGMAFFQVPADTAIWVFVAGELADAFDGPCARRWPYPNDGKYRWWRVPATVKRIEHFSDIFIATSCMFYLIRIPSDSIIYIHQQAIPIPICALCLGIFIIVFCLLIEAVVHQLRHPDSFTRAAGKITALILIRRLVYAFVGIGGGVLLLIMATPWNSYIKHNLILASIAAAALLLWYKLDRATDPS